MHDAFNIKVDAANARDGLGRAAGDQLVQERLGRVSQNWPFPLVDYWTATLAPNPADFLIGTRVTEPAE